MRIIILRVERKDLIIITFHLRVVFGMGVDDHEVTSVLVKDFFVFF